MTDLVRAIGIGAVAASRSLLPPAMAARALGSPEAARALALLSAGEFIADKTPWIPSRTRAFPLIGRMVSGAVVAAATARPGRKRDAAIAAAASAAVATFALYHLRAAATRSGRVPDAAVALCEDALALAAGSALLLRS